VGDATPRGPLSNQVALGELYPRTAPETYRVGTGRGSPAVETAAAVITGGGIAGSALFRYLAQEGQKPVLLNWGRGASWRNIAGGRTAFSVPEISEIAAHNHRLFRELQQVADIDYRPIHYISFAHDEATVRALDASRAWSDAELIEPADFTRRISPHLNPRLDTYLAALITRDCWQATPGKVVDLLRKMGRQAGGRVREDCEVIGVRRDGQHYRVLARDHDGRYVDFRTPRFINAAGPEGEDLARQLGIATGLYAVRHQAFITRRLPPLGPEGMPLGMLIDRRRYKGFAAVYGQQLAETGQIIGCASPAVDPQESGRNLKVNSLDFLEIASEVFTNWIPALASVGFQAVWAGYYVEPRMIVDPAHGLFLGLRGQGYMLAQYLARLYVDALLGREVPAYFARLALDGDGLPEQAFK
jgi:glycine/D-amino acid oxidase-like deaminating enzyme